MYRRSLSMVYPVHMDFRKRSKSVDEKSGNLLLKTELKWNNSYEIEEREYKSRPSLRFITRCWSSQEEEEKKRINKQIEKDLQKYKSVYRTQIKLLLLGTGESGKSTFLKQMRIIHGSGYTIKERLEFKLLIFQNIFQSLQSMIHAMDHLEIQYENPKSQQYANSIQAIEIQRDVLSLNDFYVKAINCIWNDGGIKKCFGRQKEYSLLDSTKYFLSDILRFAQPDYLPTDQDIIQVRKPTNGINELTVKIKEMNFRFVDVGGQRIERQKWIHCLDNIQVIIFMVSMSEYDLLCEENNSENKMNESLALFKLILLNEWFELCSHILFLNKKDIFKEKIMNSSSNLIDYFPEYNGPAQDVKAAKKFILQKFISQNQDEEKAIYYHYTCATDTVNIRYVFAVVEDTILMSNLLKYNMY